MEPTTTSGNAFAVDASGDAVLLSSCGQQVMMQWERAYMERCVDALRVTTSDNVLEIGFGLAYSATHIQLHCPRQHTIIECDTAVLERAHAFANDRQGVEIVAGTWQHVVPTLGLFDAVFFDDYPLPELETMHNALSNEISVRSSRWLDFLDVVLPHVRPGGRITGYLARPLDLTRDGLHVDMTPMSVMVSSSCTYYPHTEAFVPVITVIDPVVATTSRRHLQRERLVRVRDQLVDQEMMEEMHKEDEDDSGVHNDSVSTLPTLQHDSPMTRETSGNAYKGYASRQAYLASLRARRTNS